MNIYIDLTDQFNEGRLRAIISSGQAVVLHRLAIMSKDGDWIVREDEEALLFILQVLNRHGARYRFGAPLDKKWLAGGWSSHFEFMKENMRIRTDFVSRPPRISVERLGRIWIEQENRHPPYMNCTDLAELKKTNREKDYAIIGELSRKMDLLEDRIRYSRSAREILDIYRNDPASVMRIVHERGIEKSAFASIETLETALDAERRRLIHANERRLERYSSAAERWAEIWNEVEKETAGLSLMDAHAIIKEKASGILPFKLSVGEIHE
ncbi:MAG: hypothetical protein JW913_04000 [Chitinispirillaceae bacterium]|nr:hypothetical protein [Chitinispirillaceae bacterium]